MLKDDGTARRGGFVVKSEERRRRSLGIYYTPHTAAQILARWAIRKRSDTVLEPSFGGCALLQAAVDRLRHLGSKKPSAQLSGYDVDIGAFGYLYSLLGRDSGCERQFMRADFLLTEPHNKALVSTVIANPPFVSWHRMSIAQREIVKKWRHRYGHMFPMTASLWAYFLVHSTQFLAPDGRLAFVLPASSLTADYGRAVLDVLARRFLRVHLFRLNEQLFIQAGAQERTVLVLAEDRQVHEASPGRLYDRTVASLIELEETLASLEGSECRPIDYRDDNPAASTLTSLRKSGKVCELGSLARVTIGEVVGDTRFFVKTLSEWEAIGIDSQRFPPLLTGVKQVAGIKLVAGDVRSRYSAVPRLLVKPAARPSSRIQKYLSTYPSAARQKNATFSKRSPWYAVSYDHTAKAFMGSISHDGPRILLNNTRISCANGLYKLQSPAGQKWQPALALAALSTITRLSAELRARALGSGGLKLEPSDVRGLDVPQSSLEVSQSEATSLIADVDKLMRAGEKDAAVRLVDQRLLITTGLLTPDSLRELKGYVDELRHVRVRKVTS